MITDETVYAILGTEPLKAKAILDLIRGEQKKPHAGCYVRQLDAALAKLKRNGSAFYLRKANGGPGWVRTHASDERK